MQVSSIIEQLASVTNLDTESLIVAGIQSFLRDKKKDILLEKLKLLSRYGATTQESLEKKIEDGEVEEHPAWEDLILVENLEAKLKQIDEYLEDLSNSVGSVTIQVH